MDKLIAFCLLLHSFFVIIAQNTEIEEEALKALIQTAYVEGLQNEGDAGKIDAGIHPGFNLLGIGEGNTMWYYSIADWKAKAVQKRNNGELPLTGKDLVSIKFRTIDVTGTAAMAKIEVYIREKLTYIDYISLYKFADGWKIVSKIFYKF